MNKIFKTKSEAKTRAVAARFGKTLKGGEIVALIGDLGAGKTQWVKGMAKGLGIQETITSPTFVLMKCFAIKQRGIKNQSPRSGIPFAGESRIRNLCHVDAYRLKNASELAAIGIKDYLGEKETITVIEWAERVEELLAGKKVIRVEFKFGEKEEERIIKIFI